MPRHVNGIIGEHPTEQESYEDGWATGRSWEWGYRPGGPHVPNLGRQPDERWAFFCAEMQRNQTAWLAGFDRGLAGQPLKIEKKA